MEVKVFKLQSTAIMPKRATDGSVGYDLFSDAFVVIKPGNRALVSTNIVIAIPPGHYGRIAPRSGMSAKYSIDVGAGVIDQDYRGNIMVLLINNGITDYVVKNGDKIAQLIFERVSLPTLVQAESLDETKRGTDGFGSTGQQ